MCRWLSKLFGTFERPSPQDYVPSGGITVHETMGEVTIDITKLNIPLIKQPKVWVPEIPDTNSMDGVFDLGNNNILIGGTDKADHKTLVDFLKVGDIAVYRTALVYAIHRIVKIDSDAQGKYFKFQGDNNYTADTVKVREKEIEWVSIGVIY